MGNDTKHILIADDSQDDREMYAQHLTQRGYRVSTATNGKEALEKAFELRPHLIMIDLRLPAIDGWEATQRLKADERTKDCPVLVITGLTWLRRTELECDGWLTKPCPLDQLDKEIVRILDERNGFSRSLPGTHLPT